MTTSLHDEVLALEKRYWQALADGDVEAMLALTQEPCIIAGAEGLASLERKALSRMMEAPNWRVRGFELRDVVVQEVGPDVAVIAYRVREELVVDGQPVVLDATDASVWVRGEPGWLCALHTESIAGDPFGRDRTPAPA